MATAALVLNVLSAVSAAGAAVLWFLSAKDDLPPPRAYFDKAPANDPFFVAMRKATVLNRWAAICAAASSACTAVAIFITLKLPPAP